jgi:hypothetical protein
VRNKIIILSLFIIVSSGTFVNSFSFNIDDIVFVARVIDGDTFETNNGIRVRLADIDAPDHYQRGYKEAKAYLESLILAKEVYVDIDPKGDFFGRLISLVYLIYNATHYVNINYLLILENHAVIDDYPNEFDPYTWTLYDKINDNLEPFPFWIIYNLILISITVLVILFLYRRRFIEARLWP